MYYRNTTPQDIDRVMDLFIANSRCGIDPDLLPGVPAALRAMVQIDSTYPAQSCVFEDSERSPLAAFALSVFVHDWFVQALFDRPEPFLGNAFYRALANGHTPMLNAQEIALANALGELNLLTLHYVERIHELMHSANSQLRTLSFPSFTFSCAGFGMKALLFETYGEEAHQYMAATGTNRVVDFAQHPKVSGLAPNRWPAWSLLRRGDPGALGPANAQFVSIPNPQLGLTPGQQRVLLAALQGRTDQQIAATYSISVDAVRQSWEGVFNRCTLKLPALGQAAENAGSRRGPERRRTVLEYMMSHLQELRPYKLKR